MTASVYLENYKSTFVQLHVLAHSQLATRPIWRTKDSYSSIYLAFGPIPLLMHETLSVMAR